MKLTTTNMHPRWTTPARKAFAPEGITLGAEVVFDGLRTGQVWDRAREGRTWWIVTPDGTPYARHEKNIELLAQCTDEPLPIEGVA